MPQHAAAQEIFPRDRTLTQPSQSRGAGGIRFTLFVLQEPLVEEYSIASKLWKLSPTDLCEISRYSVLQSGYEHSKKEDWLGPKYFLHSSEGNDPVLSHLPDVRVAYRFETYHDECDYLEACLPSELADDGVQRFMFTLDEEDLELLQVNSSNAEDEYGLVIRIVRRTVVRAALPALAPAPIPTPTPTPTPPPTLPPSPALTLRRVHTHPHLHLHRCPHLHMHLHTHTPTCVGHGGSPDLWFSKSYLQVRESCGSGK